MRTGAVDILLTLLVVCVWLGCVGLVRLRDPLDRLHGVAFVNVTIGLTLPLAGFAAEGLASRSIKILMIGLLMLLGGALGTNVAGRALLQRAGK